MGCCSSRKYKLTKENLIDAEQRLLNHNGLEQNDFEVKDIKVSSFEGEDVYIRTLIIDIPGPVDKPVMVVIHGYGSSGALLYKIHKPLSERFKLYFLDTIGMSASSRPKDYDRMGSNA